MNPTSVWLNRCDSSIEGICHRASTGVALMGRRRARRLRCVPTRLDSKFGCRRMSRWPEVRQTVNTERKSQHYHSGLMFLAAAMSLCSKA